MVLGIIIFVLVRPNYSFIHPYENILKLPDDPEVRFISLSPITLREE